jgi:hypothetical protein
MSDAHRSEPELDADALAMLRAYRAEEQLPAELHDRVWSRVRADVEPSARRWLRYGAVVGVLAAAAVAVLWMGGQLLRGEPRAPASQAGYERGGSAPDGVVEPRVPQPAAPRAAAPGEAQVEPVPSPESTVMPESVASDAAAATTSGSRNGGRRGPADGDRRAAPSEPEPAPVEPTPAPGDTLAEENRLLARARAALIDGQPEQALARLGEHARRFPDGVLSEECKALRAVALCEAGRDAEGEAAAQAFLREHPRAALAPRVRSACLE